VSVSIKTGLKINIGKSKEMRINSKNKNPTQTDGNIIENVVPGSIPEHSLGFFLGSWVWNGVHSAS
jgi:hypothetical protein